MANFIVTDERKFRSAVSPRKPTRKSFGGWCQSAITGFSEKVSFSPFAKKDIYSYVNKDSSGLNKYMDGLTLRQFLCYVSFFLYDFKGAEEDQEHIPEDFRNFLRSLQVIKFESSDIVTFNEFIEGVKPHSRFKDVSIKAHEGLIIQVGNIKVDLTKDNSGEDVSNLNEDNIEEYVIDIEDQNVLPYLKYNLNNNELHPEAFFGFRHKFYNEKVFFNHSIYDQIADSIEQNQYTLIIGNPRSGKTRIVYDTLLKMEHGLVIWPQLHPYIQQYTLPGHKSMIIVFDDLDDHFRKNPKATNRLLAFALRQGIKVVATCRTGPEFEYMRSKMNHDLFSEFRDVMFNIPRFKSSDNESLDDFLKDNKGSFKSSLNFFDGNIGSVVLDLEEMKKRYEKLKEDDKKLSIAILVGLKLHYYFHNYEISKSTYNEGKIRHFCSKYLKMTSISDEQWQNAKLELESTETNLNFIEEGEYIRIEESYLDSLVDAQNRRSDVIHDWKDFQLRRLLDRIYRIPKTRQRLGFPSHITDYNRIIRKAQSYKEGKRILESIPKEINPNAATYTALMSLTNDFGALESLYKIMSRAGYEMEHVPNHVLVKQFTSFKSLLDGLQKINPKLLERRNGNTDRLIRLAERDPKESLNYLFTVFAPIEIYKNPVFNNIVRTCISDLEDYQRFLKPFENYLDTIDLNLRKNFIRALLKVKQYDIAEQLLEKNLSKEKYDYWNEKANIVSNRNFEEGLALHRKALGFAKTLDNELKTLTNICRVHNKYRLPDPTGDDLANLHQLIKDNYDTVRQISMYPYSHQNLVVLEIKTHEDNVENRLAELFKLDYLSTGGFKRLLKQSDEELVISDKQKDILGSLIYGMNE